MQNPKAQHPDSPDFTTESDGATVRTDAANARTKLRRSSRFASGETEPGTQRDWGLYAMAVYGSLAVAMGGFAVFAVTKDPGRSRVIANRPTTLIVRSEIPAGRPPEVASHATGK